MSDVVESASAPESVFSRPIEEVEERWYGSLDDDDVVALAERLCVRVKRPFDTDKESLAVQAICGLEAIGELGPGLMTVQALEVALFAVLPRHGGLVPDEAGALVKDLDAALPFFREEGLLLESNEADVRAWLGGEGFETRLAEALGNVDLFDDEKQEQMEEAMELDKLRRAAEKVVKTKAKAKKDAKRKVTKLTRRRQR